MIYVLFGGGKGVPTKGHTDTHLLDRPFVCRRQVLDFLLANLLKPDNPKQGAQGIATILRATGGMFLHGCGIGCSRQGASPKYIVQRLMI